ncbi:MAG: TetR/AcrR family transcriptional regulator [Candidatus Marinimicrobia bacterium]|nr:TetR/AcrR family transcriptional regulator [Candidatus Neomarinimicrobiota bacterium]MCF7829467.1 TetR/AcrR family transcriptional regulator [Candidatus Neomarinimicrobiota bacterium]MCF7882346.1 TetR/AcrR family transcriptional regulator [Candidatus Neomarinimicrobiota bacterium]
MNTRKEYFDEGSPQSEILYAALEEFVQFGKKGARMQSIADRAGVNKALLHYYFSNKENLHQEVLRRIFQYAFSRVSASLEEASEPRDQMRELISRYYDFIAEFPELPRLMIHEIHTNPDEIVAMFSQIFTSREDRNYPQAIFEVITQGIQKGQFRQVDPRQFMITILSTILFFFVAKPLLTKVIGIENEEKFIIQRKAHIQDVLLTYLERDKA